MITEQKWVLRNLFDKLLIFWRDISHSREDQCNQLQTKRNEEKAKARDICDLFLMIKDESVKILKVREVQQ